MADFTLKAGDLEPGIELTLVDTSGAAVDVIGASSVKFRFATSAGVELFVRNCELTDVVNGVVSYLWQAGDTDVVGSYYGEFVIEWPGARDQTYPPSGYILVAIEKKL